MWKKPVFLSRKKREDRKKRYNELRMVEAISTMGEHEHELKGAKAVSFAVSESCESCGAVLHHQQQQQQPQFQHSDIKVSCLLTTALILT